MILSLLPLDCIRHKGHSDQRARIPLPKPAQKIFPLHLVSDLSPGIRQRGGFDISQAHARERLKGFCLYNIFNFIPESYSITLFAIRIQRLPRAFPSLKKRSPCLIINPRLPHANEAGHVFIFIRFISAQGVCACFVLFCPFSPRAESLAVSGAGGYSAAPSRQSCQAGAQTATSTLLQADAIGAGCHTPTGQAHTFQAALPHCQGPARSYAQEGQAEACSGQGKPQAPAWAAIDPKRFYEAKSGRRLTGMRLASFEYVLAAFEYSRNRADAADAWLDYLPGALTASHVESIASGARAEALERSSLIGKGCAPRTFRTFLESRGWEDYEDVKGNGPAHAPGQAESLPKELTREERAKAKATLERIRAELKARGGFSGHAGHLYGNDAAPRPGQQGQGHEAARPPAGRREAPGGVDQNAIPMPRDIRPAANDAGMSGVNGLAPDRLLARP